MRGSESVSRRIQVYGPVLLATLFLLSMLTASPFFGAEQVDVSMGLRLIGSYGFSESLPEKLTGWEEKQILRNIVSNRILRSLMGIAAGAGLAVVGAALQAILRNPLVAPSTLGVSTAAAVGAFCTIIGMGTGLSLGPFSAIQVGAYLAALVDIVVIYGIARLAGRLSMVTLLLAGITVNLICGALILLMRHQTDNPYDLHVLDHWLMGSLNSLYSWHDLWGILPLLLPGLAVILLLSHQFNPMALGDEYAAGRGVSVRRVQLLVFVFGSLAVAGIVSVVGPIGFVGLIVPHMVRRLVQVDQRVVMITSLLSGGGFLLMCDCLVRFKLIGGVELPVGVLTALMGGPIFLYVLIHSQRGERYNLGG